MSLEGLSLFQAVRGGIEFQWVFDRSRGPNSPRILTLDLIRSEHTDNELMESIRLPVKRSERLCHPVQFLWIERLSFLPEGQRHGSNFASQCQSGHFIANSPFF